MDHILFRIFSLHNFLFLYFKVAAIMNEHFVNVKVDREERPDVDKVYMNFVQASTGGGGWPMSVFLTPSLKPVFGGTYFPPEDQLFGRPGFKSVLMSLAMQWRSKGEEMKEAGEKIIEALGQQSRVASGSPSSEHSGQSDFLNMAICASASMIL